AGPLELPFPHFNRRPGPMRRSLLPAALLACTLAATTFVGAVLVAMLLMVTCARAGEPVFRITPDTLRASAIGEWLASLSLENHGDWGLYPDSLSMDWVSTDPDSRSLLRWAMPYQVRGYTVAIVSQPGSGRSSGLPDQSGPASVAAVSAALERLEHAPGVDALRVLVWGQDDGATTALLAGVRHPEV